MKYETVTRLQGMTEGITMRKRLGMFLAVAGLVLGISTSVNAGMNGAESSLYAAASGTFEYNGRTYKAAPEYLSQLSSYLNRPDIDLTAAQAESAKSQMYANVAEGVAQGYIIPTDGGAPDVPTQTPTVEPSSAASVSPSKVPEEDASKKPEEKPSKEPAEDSSAQPAGDEDKPQDTPDNQSESKKPDVEEMVEEAKEQIENDMPSSINKIKGLSEAQKENLRKRLSQRTQKEDADCVAEYDVENQRLQVTLKDGSIFYLPDDMTDDFMKQKLMPIKSVLVVMLVLAVISGACLLAFGCVQLQRKHRPSYSTHKNRKVIRKVTDIVLCIALSMSLTVISVSVVVETNYMNDHKLVDSLSESGYFHEAYESVMGEVHSILTTLGYEETLCDEVLSFDNFSFATRNNMYQKLNGRDSQATFQDTQNKIVELVGNNVNLGVGILTIYQSAIDNIVGDIAYVTRNAYHSQSMGLIAMAVIIAVLSMMLMLLSDHYQHRSARRIAIAICITAALQAVFAGWFVVAKPYTRCYIKPDYFYLSFERFMSNGISSMFVAVAVFVFAGILLALVAHSMKKKVQK